MQFIQVLLTICLWLEYISATPVENQLLPRAPPCKKLSEIDDNYFLSRLHERIKKQGGTLDISTCLFYTRGLTESAKVKARGSANLNTLWDVFDCKLYDDGNSQQSPESELRCIMDEGNRLEYFKRMSQAYSKMCGGVSTLMTEDPNKIPQDGIWRTDEQPTLMRNTDFTSPKRMAILIDACNEDLQDCDVIYKRDKAPPSEAIAAVIASARNRLRKPPSTRDLPDGECFDLETLVAKFDDLPW